MSKLRALGSLSQRILKRDSPRILKGLGIAGLMLVPIQAVRITPTAMALLERERRKKQEELTAWETIKTAWRCYISSVALSGLSLAFVCWSSAIDSRRNLALITAYTISESALREYQHKVVEMFGKGKEESVRDSLARDHLRQNPVVQNEVHLTHQGDTLCYDVFSGRYFRTDIHRLQKAENKINKRLLSEMYVSLNDFYDEIGLPIIKAGELSGWHVDKGFLEFDLSSQLAEDGTPCLVISYKVFPEHLR